MLPTSLLFFFSSLGVFNGLLVSLYFLFSFRSSRVQNSILGLLLLMMSIRTGKSVYITFTPKSDLNLWILQVGLTACFLIGICLYYYIKSATNNQKSIPRSWKIHFLFLLLLMVSFGAFYPYVDNASLWQNYVIKVIYAVWGAYILSSIILLKNLFFKMYRNVKALQTFEIWLLFVLGANVLIYGAYIFGYFKLYVLGTLTFSLVFYLLLIFLLFKKNRDSIFRDKIEKYNAKIIDIEEANGLLLKLEYLMKEEQMYKNTGVNLQRVANKMHIVPHKLSQLINDNVGMSFTQYVNMYRIEEAKKILESNVDYTLEAIGYESGFSSKSNFYATFKKMSGKTPSQYKKECLQN